MVGIRFLNFKNISHQMSFSEPLSTTNEVYEAAKKLLRELWKDRRPIRLISISLTNLTKLSGCRQLSFFDVPGKRVEVSKKSDERVDKVIDALRKRYGFDVIKRGGVMKLELEVGGKLKGNIDADVNNKI